MDHAADYDSRGHTAPECSGLLYGTAEDMRDELQKGLEAVKEDIQKTTEDIKDEAGKPTEQQRQLQLPPTMHRCTSLPQGQALDPYLHRSTELPVSPAHIPACSPGHTSGQAGADRQGHVNQHRPPAGPHRASCH